MTDYTTREILDAIGVRRGTDEQVAYHLEDANGQTIVLRGENVPVKQVADGGGMDEGSNLWFVVQIGDQFFRKSGYYASHYGSDWDGPFEEVKGAEKTITVYEAV